MPPTVRTPDEPVRSQIEAVKAWLGRRFRQVEDPTAIQTRTFEGYHTIAVDAGTHHVFLRVEYQWLEGQAPAEVVGFLEDHHVDEDLSAVTTYAVAVGRRGIEVTPR
jgi:hypothetical protein